MNKKDFKIIFMGTPEFATESLKFLIENEYNIVGVITAPDKPAGRGQRIMKSHVKSYAEQQQLKILQPTNLKSSEFIEELKALKADLQIVVAFRMLPEIVWAMPKYGTVNLHASLLPDYRGAAPINHAIINGESKTGVTTFFIEKEIDTGEIILREETEIDDNETAGELHDRLMDIGSRLIEKTVSSIVSGEYSQKSQNEILEGRKPKLAPKIFKNDCKINWNQETNQIYNFIRGLSPYPAAWTEFKNKKTGKVLSCKIFDINKTIEKHSLKTGDIVSDNKNEIKISAIDGYISIKSLQLAGKKRMICKELLNGFNIFEYENK